MAKRRSRKPSRKRYRARRSPWPVLFQQRHYDIVGLALVAASVYFALVFYLGWNGGQVGDLLHRGFFYGFGQISYLVPAAVFTAGALLVARPLIPSLAPYRTGALCVFASLTMLLAANAFDIVGSGPRQNMFLNGQYLESHGGLVGESLYWASSNLIQRAGSIILATFLLVAGLVLLTNVSLSDLLRSGKSVLGGATNLAKLGTQEFAEKLSIRLRQTEDRAASDAVAETVQNTHGTVALEPEDYSATEQISATAEEDVRTMKIEPDAAGETKVAIARPELELTPQGNRRSAVTEAEGRSYKLPAVSILRRSNHQLGPDTSNRKEIAKNLVEVLGHFNVEAEVIGMVSGPHITRYELKLAPGTKVSKVSQLRDDIAYALASTEIRILAPIPGKQAVGVEIPNRNRRLVTLGDIIQSTKKTAKSGPPADSSPLTVWLGKDVSGRAVWTDLARMPHILVAGTTGSGKSGCINAMLSSILARATPDQLRMVLIDPKQVELNYYEAIPHLLAPLVTAPRLAANVLGNLVKEMEARYSLMSEARSRNLVEFNRYRIKNGDQPLPYILCVVDELADLMMVAPADVENSIIRLAQKSRAVGIHLVLATQRPSTDIITGTIKVNIPARIAFAVSSQVDSRVILDQGGAETLLGMGDMLFKSAGSSKLERIQGAYITEEEVAALTDHWSMQGEPEIDEELLSSAPEPDSKEEFSPDQDDLLEEAASLVVQTQTASVSMLQRRLRVGYTRAGRLVDMLERRGIISGYEGSKPRQVLVQESELARILGDISTATRAVTSGSVKRQPLAVAAISEDDSDETVIN